jgi:hypothetical protein
VTVNPIPIPQPQAVSRRNACFILRIGERQLRRLVRAGRLLTSGCGYSAKITLVSLLEFMNSRAEKAAIGGHPPEFAALCPTLCYRHLDGKADAPHSEIVEHVIETTNHMAGELLPLSRGAAAVGMSEKVFRRLVDDGVIPSVPVGSRRRVNADVLRAWSRGSARVETV